MPFVVQEHRPYWNTEIESMLCGLLAMGERIGLRPLPGGRQDV